MQACLNGARTRSCHPALPPSAHDMVRCTCTRAMRPGAKACPPVRSTPCCRDCVRPCRTCPLVEIEQLEPEQAENIASRLSLPVGLEGNRLMPDGRIAPDTAELVAAARALLPERVAATC